MPSEIAIAVPQVSPGVPTSAHVVAKVELVRNSELSRVRNTLSLYLKPDNNANKIRCSVCVQGGVLSGIGYRAKTVKVR
jgi:hypothetical protein